MTESENTEIETLKAVIEGHVCFMRDPVASKLKGLPRNVSLSENIPSFCLGPSEFHRLWLVPFLIATCLTCRSRWRLSGTAGWHISRTPDSSTGARLVDLRRPEKHHDRRKGLGRGASAQVMA